MIVLNNLILLLITVVTSQSQNITIKLLPLVLMLLIFGAHLAIKFSQMIKMLHIDTG